MNQSYSTLGQTEPNREYPQTMGGTPIYGDEPVPNPDTSNKLRRLEINELNRGYVVTVGCHQFAIETAEQLISKLTEYINEPAKTEAKWFSKQLF